MIRSLAVVTIITICNFTLRAQSSTPSFVSDSLDKYITQGMKDWDIPGLAIAIVKNNQVVTMKGFGVRDINTKAPVDENTLFMIASNSKLFTATAVAQLEFQNKLSLDDKVTKYFKDYELYDKNASEMVTVRDMLSHRIGTKTFQGDFTFWNSKLSRYEIIKKMRLLKPVGQFRQEFGYCNSCFLTAGEIIPIVSGKPWEVYVYDSILIPLGMNNTHMLSQGIAERPNVARPYTSQFTGSLYEPGYDKIDNIGPAGSMVSNVKDMSKWLMMQLDSGRYQGKRILPWAVLQRTRDVNTTIRSRKSPAYPTHFSGYGLGVFSADYNGRQIYYHTGGAFGFVTNTCFVPEEKLGIVILTNNDNQDFFEALRYQLLDAYLGVPYVNRSLSALPSFRKGEAVTISKINDYKARIRGTSPPLALGAYVGTYENELYGEMEIKPAPKGKDLKLSFKGHNTLTATLAYMDNDEWLLTYSNLAFGIFPTKFETANGKVVSLSVKANDFIEYDPYTFTKK